MIAIFLLLTIGNFHYVTWDGLLSILSPINCVFNLLKYQFEKERNYSIEEDKFPLIYIITALYTTFILEEPIHPVGTEFPGSLKVEEKNEEFYCPVKDKQKDNENAICNLCLAEQTPGI